MSLRPHGLLPSRLLCPWNFPGKNTGVGCHFLLQRIFPPQESNPCLLHLLHWQVDSFTTAPPEKPKRCIQGMMWLLDPIGYVRRFSWLPEFGAWIAIVWLHLRFHFLIYKMWPYNSFLKGLMWRLSELIWVLRLEQCLTLEEISTCMHAQLLSRVQLFATPWTEAYQAPLSMGSSRQEYWNGLPFPSGLDLPNPEVELEVPTLTGGFLITVPPGKPKIKTSYHPPPIFFFFKDTLYVRQQKRHRCIEQSFGLCGRRRGWDDLGEWHWNMYIIICETNHQSRFDAWYRVLRAGALGWPRGTVWGGRWEGSSGWGTHVHPWWIHVNVRQNHYNIVK